jgi:putative DNA primase/helicase
LRSICISFGGQKDLAAIVSAQFVPWHNFALTLTTEPPEVTDKAARGWYIPAEFSAPHRDSQTYVARHAITYDFDHVNIETWGEVLNAWENLAFAMYTTFSHRADRPRFRVVLPLSRPAGFDEFQAVARRVATDIGIELVARESFVPAQMMFCPTRTLGGLFTGHVNKGEWLDVDEVLGEYADWTDPKQWPHRRDGDAVYAASEGRVDPRDKPGIIGEFNRAFSISQAIERFELPYRKVR